MTTTATEEATTTAQLDAEGQATANGGATNGDATTAEVDILYQYLPKTLLRRGDIVDGKVLQVNDGGLLVDIGQKSEGFVPMRETRMLTEGEGDEALPVVGDEVLLYVFRAEGEGYPLLSIDRARGEHGWRDLEKSHESEATVRGRIIGANRGGAVVQVNGVQGFVPLSQLVGPARDLFASDGAPPKPGFIGMELDFKVLELNRRRNRAIFSERAAMDEINLMRKMKLVQELEEGDIRRGRVAGISTFGAFVELGGADGLVHISEMSWSSVNRPEEVVQVGQELDVLVLKVDRENLKIALSMKRLVPEPWESIEDELSVGQIVEGKITKLAAFGAFARIEAGIEGLVHVSELTTRRIESPAEVVSEGEMRKFKVIRIEPERRRLGLSLKQVNDEVEDDAMPVAGGVDDSGFGDIFDED